MGPRGKARFAKALGLSPSTYEYYEQSRVPPAAVLVKIAQVAGVDLRWLLTGEGSAAAAAGATTNHPALQRAAALIGDHPRAAGPLAAFLDLLTAAMEFPKKDGAAATLSSSFSAQQRSAAQRGFNRAGTDAAPQAAQGGFERVQELAAAQGTQRGLERVQADVAPQAADASSASWDSSTLNDAPGRSWVPILGRSAAGVPQFWDRDSRDAGVTTLSDLIGRHAGQAATVQHGQRSWADPPAAPQAVQIVTLTAPAGDVSQFVAAADIKARYGDAFAVRIDGDSMSPDIRHGDLVVLSPSQPAADGKAAVVQLDGQIGVTCKLYRRSGPSVHLIPINERVPHTVVAAEAVQWALRVLALVRA
ncbi:MAG: S24 family peptidase [Planctomycetaceae bacterium]|nr:helix-turn-helix domain-containing protein [Planctomycetaceae bacterium]